MHSHSARLTGLIGLNHPLVDSIPGYFTMRAFSSARASRLAREPLDADRPPKKADLFLIEGIGVDPPVFAAKNYPVIKLGGSVARRSRMALAALAARYRLHGKPGGHAACSWLHGRRAGHQAGPWTAAGLEGRFIQGRPAPPTTKTAGKIVEQGTWRYETNENDRPAGSKEYVAVGAVQLFARPQTVPVGRNDCAGERITRRST